MEKPDPRVPKPATPAPGRAPSPLPPPQPNVPIAPVYGRPGATPPPPAPVEQPETSEWDDIPRDTRYYVPKPKRNVPLTVALSILFAAVALGAGGYLWKVLQQKQADAKKVIVIKAPDLPATAPVMTRPTTIVVSRSPAPAPEPEPEPAPDPRRKTREWEEIEQARHDDPVIAIVKFDLYRSTYPGVFTRDLDQYTDEALDVLWWKRIIELFKERDDARAEIDRRKEDLRTAQDPEFKKTLEAEIAKLAQQRDYAQAFINNQMQYTRPSPPNIYDSQDLAALRAQRNKNIYEPWKMDVLKAIRSSRGERLPWKQTR